MLAKTSKSEWSSAHKKINQLEDKMNEGSSGSKMDDQEIFNFKKKYEEILSDLKGISFISKGVQLAGEKASHEIFTKINNNVLDDLKERLSKIEAITLDYIKLFVEPESLAKGQQLSKGYILIEEKLDCLLFLIKNYKLINPLIVKKGLNDYKESLSKINFKSSKFKNDGFEEIYKLIKHFIDLDSDQTYFLLECLFLVIYDGTNIFETLFDVLN